jgi:hypothetical protein
MRGLSPPSAALNSRVAWIAVVLAAILLGTQLLVKPIVGLANEGDFERVMGPSGFKYLTDKYDDKYWGYVVSKFAIVPGARAEYLTSEIPLSLAARFIGRGVFSRTTFDIRILGFLHIILLVVAIGLLVRACRDLAPATQWVVAALLVFVFTDVGYAAAFNSFYPQTASLLFLLLAISCAALGIRRGALDGVPLVFYFLFAGLFVCSKPQEAVQGPILAAMGVWLARAPGGRSWRRSVPLALALCAVSVWYYRQIPQIGVRNVGRFHNVFSEILPHSPDPGKDLDELRLDRDLIRYSGMNAYQKDSPFWEPAFQARFFDRFGYRDLVLFYLRHPPRLLDRLGRGAPEAFRLRPRYLGNFEPGTGLAPKTRATHFAVWSDLRKLPRPRAVLWLLGFFGANLAAVAWNYHRASPRGRTYLVFLAFLLLMAGVEFLACALGDALFDLGRHLYLFDALCDLILIGDVAWLTQAIVDSIRGRGLVVEAVRA